MAYDAENAYLTLGDLLIYDALAASTTAQAAQAQRAAAAEAAHAWFTSQQAASPGDAEPSLRAEYMRRAAIIDAAYEVAVEPHRQAFLEQYPGMVLPEFLQPGVRSFAGRLQELDTGEKGAGTVGRAGVVNKRGWAGMSWLARLGVVAGSVMVLFGIVVLSLYVIVENEKRDELRAARQPVTLPTACEIGMKNAALEPDSTKADPLILATLRVCGSKAEWVAALEKHPAAMGVYEVTGTEWAAACIGEEDAPACSG
ncbi:hypothetical protein ART_2005 [Arthrobacter sp. PAMC 25486]|uniref:hypothetical protein n=1 Tax=Arthrobacter sp. PAMC 25486 TaxID=1494608 RepID=UPI0005362A96|nr:hypothetical protein [Arthrobacter sp. PAMC 25486]AIY01604.1 hypothetical protein ART_2005 [Arthrobacter sp. PAMC 25486]